VASDEIPAGRTFKLRLLTSWSSEIARLLRRTTIHGLTTGPIPFVLHIEMTISQASSSVRHPKSVDRVAVGADVLIVLKAAMAPPSVIITHGH
jgi:hypothetical protein